MAGESTPAGKLAELQRLQSLPYDARMDELRRLSDWVNSSRWAYAGRMGVNAGLDEAFGPLRPSNMPKLKRPSGAFSGALWVADVGLNGVQNWQDYRNDSKPDLRVEKMVVATAYDTAVTAVGTGLGTAGGAAIGGILGPVGAAVGGRVGGMVGGMAADWLSNTAIGEKVKQAVVSEGAELLDKGVDTVKGWFS